MKPNKILVAYASRAGSTGGVAEAIGKTLADGGMSVDVRRMNDIREITPYGAVVAGSAIRGRTVAWISGRESRAVARRAQELGITVLLEGVRDKRQVLRALISERTKAALARKRAAGGVLGNRINLREAQLAGAAARRCSRR